MITEACWTLNSSCKLHSHCILHPGPLPDFNSFLSPCPVLFSIYSPSLFTCLLSLYFSGFELLADIPLASKQRLGIDELKKKEKRERINQGHCSNPPEVIKSVSLALGGRAGPRQSQSATCTEKPLDTEHCVRSQLEDQRHRREASTKKGFYPLSSPSWNISPAGYNQFFNHNGIVSSFLLKYLKEWT